jgi:hypothetical protein
LDVTEPRQPARHAATATAAAQSPAGVEPDEVWVPPPFEPVRPGDFIEYSSATFEVRRRSRPGLVLLLCLLLAAAGAGGWWYLRHQSAAPQTLSCQAVYDKMPTPLQHYLHVAEGGTLPDGIPMPLGEAGTRCTASNKTGSGLIVVWPGGSESAYATLLGAGGWTSARVISDYTFYVNGGDSREVVTTTMDGQLITMYDK